MKGLIGAIGVLIMFIAIVGLIAYFVNGVFVGYEYDKVVGAHIENAYEVNTPERMVTELQLAKDGMKELGLTEDMYGAWIFEKPDNSMKFQYEFIDSIIERAESVVSWKETTYGGNVTNTETMGDVYEQKMDNLREFIKEGGDSDWIARNAWYVNFHFYYYNAVSISVCIICMIFAFIGFAILESGYNNSFS